MRIRKGLPRRVFLFDETYRTAPRRRPPLPPALSGWGWAGLALLVIGLFLVREAAPALDRWDALETRGLQADGRLVDQYVETDAEGDPTGYYLVYEFTARDEQTHRVAQQVSRSVYDHYEPGLPAAVRYLPDDPAVSTLSTAHVWPYEAVGWVFFWALVFLPGAAIWLIFFLRYWRRTRPGRILIGRIVDCQLSEDEDIVWLWRVDLTYEFHLPRSGRSITGQAIEHRARDKPAPEAGIPVAVRYFGPQRHGLL